MAQFLPTFNKVILMGNQLAEAIKRSSPHGSVVSFPLVTNRGWQGKDGKPKVRTDFHRITFFGPFADSIFPHLGKGRRLFVFGEIRSSSYEDKDGKKRYSWDVVGDVLYFLDSKNPFPRVEAEDSKGLQNEVKTC